MPKKTIENNKGLRKDINNARQEIGMPKVVIKKRKCLKCDKKFKSFGVWNRLCDSCTKTNFF
jgi:hypothetical protein|tara:strand:+ start:2046 stop:2231 length:186 start_codon:yes stop_codon:yes gene_type:complete